MMTLPVMIFLPASFGGTNVWLETNLRLIAPFWSLIRSTRSSLVLGDRTTTGFSLQFARIKEIT
jgi:hypothetical protein